MASSSQRSSEQLLTPTQTSTCQRITQLAPNRGSCRAASAQARFRLPLLALLAGKHKYGHPKKHARFRLPFLALLVRKHKYKIKKILTPEEAGEVDVSHLALQQQWQQKVHLHHPQVSLATSSRVCLCLKPTNRPTTLTTGRSCQSACSLTRVQHVQPHCPVLPECMQLDASMCNLICNLVCR